MYNIEVRASGRQAIKDLESIFNSWLGPGEPLELGKSTYIIRPKYSIPYGILFIDNSLDIKEAIETLSKRLLPFGLILERKDFDKSSIYFDLRRLE